VIALVGIGVGYDKGRDAQNLSVDIIRQATTE
jgi:hypothetical protein